MSKEIKKINQLSIAESFFQINFSKGYKYIDKAGEIINYFHDKEEEPRFAMNLEGLDLIPADKHATLIKVTPRSFWSHYKSPDTLDQAKNSFVKDSNYIIETLDIQNFQRIGWRSYFVKEYSDKAIRDTALKKLSKVHGLNFEQSSFTGTIESTYVNFRLVKVAVEEPSDNYGILFDIDLYQKDEKGFDVKTIQSKYSSLFDIWNSESLLEIINATLANE